MIRISLPFLFRLANELEPLASLPDETVSYGNVFVALISAQEAIEGLMSGSVYAAYLRSSRELAEKLLYAIRQNTSSTDWEREISAYELWHIKNTYSQYKIALLSELGSLNSYFVTQKGAFDTFTLLFGGERLFHQDLGAKVPEAIFDAQEAAKCLAYEVPTASAFHTFRATESVLRRYYSHVTGGKAPPKVRNLGVYINALTQSGKGDPKILAALKQIVDLHRNPLIHPEAAIAVDEALTIFGIANSAISAMLVSLPTQPPTTSSPQLAPSIASTMAALMQNQTT